MNKLSLTLSLPASYLTSATTYTVRVLTPYGSIPNGFVSGGTSAPQTLTVQNPLPTITALTPAESLVQQTTTLTITGTNFVAPSLVNSNRGTVAYLGATALPTTVLSPTTLLVTIASTVIPTAQAYSLTVRNPLVNGLGGGASNGLTFTALNPTALLGSLAVQTGTLPLAVSSATRTVLLSGQFFVSGLSVTLSRTGGAAVAPQTLTATWISSTQVSLSIPTVFLAEAGTLSLRVSNPVPTALPTGGQSNLISAAIHNPHPRLLTLTPTTATVSANDLALTLNGANFLPNSVITVIGKTLLGADTTITLAPTSYSPINATPASLTASIPTNFVALAGTYRVWVQNPAPTVNALGQSTNGISDTLQFSMLNPVPTLAAIAPTIVATGSNDTTITLTGTNFTPLSSVLLNGTTLATSRVVIQDRQTILATVPAALMTSATVINVQVRIPAPGGGTTVARTLTVRNAAPVLDSLAPAVIAAQRDTVITAYGAGFNLTSQFRLIRGTTTVTLAIVSLPTSGIAQLRIPAAAIITLATYQVRVFNSAPGGGTSVARNLLVQGGVPVSMEFLNVTTGIVAGASLTAVQVRFRDALGVLSDIPLTAPMDSLYAVRLQDSTIGDTVKRGMRLTRLSAGLYSIPSTVFTTSGTYTLSADSVIMANITTIIGNRSFTVRPTIRANVWIEFLTASASAQDSAITGLRALQSLQKLTIRYRDRFQNLTDSGVGVVRLLTVAGSPWGASTATLTMQRSSLGFYTLAAPLQITTAGTYYLNPAGLSRAVVLTTTVDSLLVTPGTPTAYIRALRPTLAAGTSQPALTMLVRDGGSNRIDLAAPSLRAVSLDTLPDGSRTEAIWTLTRTALGTYTAPALLFTLGGEYALRVFDDTAHVPVKASGFVQDSIFTVTTAVATRAEIASQDTTLSPALPDSITAGTSLPRVRILFRDASGNLTDNGVSLTSATYRVAVGVSTGTLRLERTAVGTYFLSSTMTTTFVTAGTYTITLRSIQIDSITTNGILPGRRTFVVAPAQAATVQFTSVTPVLNAGANQAAFRLQFRDRFGNNTPNLGSALADSVRYTNASTATSALAVSSGTIQLTPSGVGLFTAAVTRFNTSGSYSLSVDGITSSLGTTAFVVNPGAVRTVFIGNPSASLLVGSAIPPFTIVFRDLYGNLTEAANALNFTKSGAPASTGTISLARTSLGVSTATTLPFAIAGNYTLSVSGISTANTSGRTAFSVLASAPVPVVSAITPNTTNASAESWALTVSGSNFLPTSVIQLSSLTLGTTTLATQYINATTLTAFVSLTTASVYDVAVQNHAPGGGVSVPLPLTVNALPLVATTSVVMASPIVKYGQPLEFTLHFYDSFHNPTDYNGNVRYDLISSEYKFEPDGSYSELSSTGTISLVRTGKGVYELTSTVLTVPGIYTLKLPAVDMEPVVVTFGLDHPRLVTGTVRDRNGVPVSGVTVSFTSVRGVATTQTDVTGSYTFGVEVPGVIAPSAVGLSFEPSSLSIQVPEEDRSGLDFDAVAYRISGRVTNINGNPIPNVAITLSGGFTIAPVQTNSQGEYVINSVPPGLYNILPQGSLIGNLPLVLTPSSRSIQIAAANVANQDFQTVGQVISGRLVARNAVSLPTISGTVELYSASGTRISFQPIEIDGTYSFTVPSGTYRIVPSLENCTSFQSNLDFIPQNRTVIVPPTGQDVPNQDFSVNVQWTYSRLPNNITPTSVLTQGSTLFAVSKNLNVFRSNDEGRNWSELNNPNKGFDDNSRNFMAKAFNNNIYIGVRGDFFGVSKQGNPIEKIEIIRGFLGFNGGVEKPFTILSKGSYIYTGGQGLWRYNPVDGTTKDLSFSTSDIKIRGLAEHQNNVYVALEDYGVAKVVTEEPLLWENVARNGWRVGDMQVNVLYISPKTSLGIFFVGTERGLYKFNRTTNFWEQSTVPFSKVYTMTGTSNGSRLFVGTDMGVYFSDDDGTTWQEFNCGLGRQAVTSLFISGSGIYAASGGFAVPNTGIFRADVFPVTPTVGSITGQITSGGTGVAGITLEITVNGTTQRTTTGADGTYTFVNVPAGAYTLTPVSSAYTFAPASASISLSANGQTAQNFAATAIPVQYSISGRTLLGGAGLNNSTLTLYRYDANAANNLGAVAQVIQSQADGSYSFTNLTSGERYIVVPSLATVIPPVTGYTYSPARYVTPTALNANLTGIDFTAVRTYNIVVPTVELTFQSATFTDAETPLGGVALQLLDRSNNGQVVATASTNPSTGQFEFLNIESGKNYEVVPTKACYTFIVPVPQIFTLTDNTTIRITARRLPSIKGQVTLDGVGVPDITISAKQGATVVSSVVTDANGRYEIPCLPAGEYIVSPSQVVVNNPQFCYRYDNGEKTTFIAQITNANPANPDVNFASYRLYSISGVLSAVNSSNYPVRITATPVNNPQASPVSITVPRGTTPDPIAQNFVISCLEPNTTYTLAIVGNPLDCHFPTTPQNIPIAMENITGVSITPQYLPSITGRVSGGGCSYTRVRITRLDSPIQPTQTEIGLENGYYTFYCLQSGRYRITPISDCPQMVFTDPVTNTIVSSKDVTIGNQTGTANFSARLNLSWTNALPALVNLRATGYDQENIYAVSAPTRTFSLYSGNNNGRTWSLLNNMIAHPFETLAPASTVIDATSVISIPLNASQKRIIVGFTNESSSNNIGAIMLSDDNGQTWNIIREVVDVSGSTRGKIYGLTYNQEKNIVFAAPAGGLPILLFSLDKGYTWQSTSSITDYIPTYNSFGTRSLFSQGNYVYLGASNQLLRYNIANNTWSQISGVSGSVNDIIKLTSSSILISVEKSGLAEGGGVYRIDDNGISSQRLSPDWSTTMGRYNVQSIANDISSPNSCFTFAATGDGLWYSTNDDNTWEFAGGLPSVNGIGQIPVSDVSRILFRDSYLTVLGKSNNGIFTAPVCTNSILLSTLKIPSSILTSDQTQHQANQEKPLNFRDDKLFTNNSITAMPNPAFDNIKIECLASESGFSSVKLFTMSGQLLHTLAEGDISIGVHSFLINTSLLASGQYLCVFQTPNKRIHTVITVLH